MTPVKKMVMHTGVFAAAFWGMVLSCAAYTQILWVDDANYGKPGLDGSTPQPSWAKKILTILSTLVHDTESARVPCADDGTITAFAGGRII